MDDIRYEKILNRIIQGRLRIRLGDLVLFIEEPSRDLIEASFDVYDEAYDKAYFAGCYIEQEIPEVLISLDLWSPDDDKKAEELEKKEEDLKIQAFKSFFRKKELRGIKRAIRITENMRAKYVLKKEQFNHLTCKGVANFARKMWLLSHTCKDENGNKFDFEKSSLPIKTVMDVVAENAINPDDIRYIARNNPWRQMWTGSRKRDSVFAKSPTDLDTNQLNLISYSLFYDNVLEDPDQPDEDVINDNDCLDGWLIMKRREREKDKKQRAVESTLKNNKIANSQEVMLMANSQQEAQEIYGLNPDHARGIIRQRQDQIQKEGHLHFKDLGDVKQQRFMNAVNQGTQTIKRMGRG